MADGDAFQNFDFDPRNTQYQYASRLSWPLQHSDASASMATPMVKRSTSPLPMPSAPQSYQHTASYPPTTMMQDWQMPSPVPAAAFALDTAFSQPAFDSYGVSFQTSPTDYMPPHTSLEASMEASLNAGLPLDGSYVTLSSGDMNAMNQMPINWSDIDAGFMGYGAGTHGMSDLMSAQHAFSGGSPSSTYLSESHLDIRSLPSSSSDNGWATVDHINPGAIFNPEQTLHPRTFSDSSYSDVEHYSRNSLDGYIDVANAVSSPSTDSANDLDATSDRGSHHERHSPTVITTAMVKPIAIRQSLSTSPTQRSPVSPTSGRKLTAKKQPLGKTTSTKIARRPSQAAKLDTEKRVGRRKGPLRPDQRKQASEIRKLGACIRCRFLKKTCDKGEPCGGCKPSHARLWLVPCTRIDIKDLGYFLKGWNVDYQRHVNLGFSVGNIKGFSDQEIPLFVTHGYGHYLPINAREVYVRDKGVFGVNWTESRYGPPCDHEVNTARLSAGVEGVSTHKLSEYLDLHIDRNFEYFVDEYFDGTPFITEILKTAYRFWTRERTPVIRKALKLVLAYNLTQAICFVRVVGGEEDMEGKIEDEDSYYNGQTAAPVMINFQVKCAMADMWRELQKDILEELSTLYSSVYSRDKLKHWPTIFILATILLTIWEEMQFDCHYRNPDAAVVEKFCNDMESTPVGVIVGLFSAISQKVPAFNEWDTRKHHMLLGSNSSVCTAMEEVRDNIYRHEQYLRGRSDARFDRDDFDCLSNKFVSKLVIRAH